MESLGFLQSLVNEYEDTERTKRIDEICTKNFDERDKIFKIIDYIYSNETLTKYDLIYSNLNSDLRDVFDFIQDNRYKFNKAGLYANLFASYISKIGGTGEPVFLNSLRLKHKKNLKNKGYDISIWRFYTNIKNDVEKIIDGLNKEYVVKENTLYKEGSVENKLDADIEYNDYVLGLISELIDYISLNKNIFLGDLIYGEYKEELLEIKDFLDDNEEHICAISENSVYLKQFLRLFNTIINKGEENVIEIEREFSKELAINDIEEVDINEGYYDELKAELYDVVKDINTLLKLEKTT